MPEKTSPHDDNTFRRHGRQVRIERDGEQVAIVIDGTRHPVRFLDNGRPYTDAYVNVMAESVRDLAERFVDHVAKQEAHWEEVDAARKEQEEQEEEGTAGDYD